MSVSMESMTLENINGRTLVLRDALAKISRLPEPTQVALAHGYASLAVRQRGQGNAVQLALSQLLLADEFECYAGLIGVILQCVNNELAVYNDECCKYQVAADTRAANEAYDRGCRNVRVGGGIFTGGLSGAGIGCAVGLLGGPVGVALGIGIGAAVGGTGGGLLADATTAKK
ncbi:MAG: hypothetical protein LBI34_01745 [Puniceicoccales bacterium]|nr:hypothetical protein [Puniceicoccales bacterium]